MNEIRGGFLTRIRKGVSFENIEPKDRLLQILAPGMIQEHLARYRFAKTMIPEREEAVVILDAASGRGYGSAILSENRVKVIGVDIGEEYARKAQKEHGNFFTVGDVVNLPIESNSVDLAIAFEITEHLEKKKQPNFLKELKRVLRKDGVGVISIPCRHSFKSDGEKRVFASNPFHLYEPTRKEMKKMIEEAGLEIKGEYGQVIVKNEIEARKLRKRLNKPLNKQMFQYWASRKGRKEVREFFKVKEMDDSQDQVALTNVFVVRNLDAS